MLGGLELPAILGVVTAREFDVGADSTLDLGDDAAEILPVADVAHDDDLALPVLAADLVGPAISLNVRQRLEWNPGSARSRHHGLANAVEIFAGVVAVANREVERVGAGDHSGHRPAVERGLDALGHLAD